MTAGGHTKFLFDRDFEKDEQDAQMQKAAAEAAKAAAAAQEDEDIYGEEEIVEPEAPPPPTFSEAELAQAREEGRQAGRDEATQDMASAIEQRTAQTLETISAQIAQIFDQYELDKEQHSRDAVAVAEVIVRKLFPALNMDKALAEIEHMIIEAMKRTSGSPMLMVRVSEDMQAEVDARAQELAALRGREGTVSVVGDADVAPGDARVEWDGGGMVRDTGLVWREIDDIIERNLGERIAMPDNAASAEAPDEPLPGEAEVVNPAPVGENEEMSAESPDSQAPVSQDQGAAVPATEDDDEDDDDDASAQTAAAADEGGQAEAPDQDDTEI